MYTVPKLSNREWKPYYAGRLKDKVKAVHGADSLSVNTARAPSVVICIYSVHYIYIIISQQ